MTAIRGHVRARTRLNPVDSLAGLRRDEGTVA